MPKTSTRLKPAEELTFETAFDELEQIVQQLEGGLLPLDESLALFERGQALSIRCQAVLEAAELKVQRLAPRPGGGYVLQDFDESAV
jgi:exodeoxyribonuclease VII small subunit